MPTRGRERSLGPARSLSAAADPDDDGHDSYKEWLGENFDPECFDIAAMNAFLEASSRARKGAANSVAAVESGGVDQLDIPIRLASVEKLGRKAFLRETQEFRFVSTEQVANVAQSLELLDPKGARSPLRFP